MNRDQVIAKLREHELELRAAGVVRLSVFGSTARGDRRRDSDVDLLAAFDEPRRISLQDVAGIEIGQRGVGGFQLRETGTLDLHQRDHAGGIDDLGLNERRRHVGGYAEGEVGDLREGRS